MSPAKKGLDTMKAKSFIFSWCSCWVEEGEKDVFFFLPLSISPWFCQSVLIQPLCSLADSSTIPSEMLIWQLTVQPSAFPSFASHVHISWMRSLSLPFSLSLSCSVPLSPLTDLHKKAEFSSGLFKISTNLREGQRSCTFCILQDKTK